MCIRDRASTTEVTTAPKRGPRGSMTSWVPARAADDVGDICLLYTSDAADERSSVDLGGRRIIKKKKTTKHGGGRTSIA